MSTDLPHGSLDPWRMYTYEELVENEAQRTGQPLEEKTLEFGPIRPADRVHKHLLKIPGCDTVMMVYGVSTAHAAVQRVVLTVQQPPLCTVLKNQGCVIGPKDQCTLKGFTLEAAGFLCCFPDAETAAQGYRRLVTMLVRAGAMNPEIKTLLAQYGLEPIIS